MILSTLALVKADARLRWPDGEARNTHYAVLLAQQVECFCSFLCEANDPLGIFGIEDQWGVDSCHFRFGPSWQCIKQLRGIGTVLVTGICIRNSMANWSLTVLNE